MTTSHPIAIANAKAVLLPIHKNVSPDSPWDKLPDAAEVAVADAAGEPPFVVVGPPSPCWLVVVAALIVEVFDGAEVVLWLLIQVVDNVGAVLKIGKAVLTPRSCPPKEPCNPAATKTFISNPIKGIILV